ncbi:MAG: DUF1553 domain-containing protein [Actinomycetota bacterium]
MSHLRNALIAGCLLLAHPADAAPVARRRQPAAKRGAAPGPALPRAMPIERLEVYPSEVIIDRRRGYRQLVVTGYVGGEPHDFTHAAKTRIANEKVATVLGGRVAPTGNGQTVIKVALGSRSIVVPVRVTGFAKPDPVRFQLETLPSLTKQGCSTGSCHGAPHGKGGFALSLFGYDPRADRIALTRDGFNRRVNVLEPKESLILKKPLLEVPHVGGKRLRKTDAAYRILHDWVYAGARADDAEPSCERIEIQPGPGRVLRAPNLTQQLSVLAYYDDGTTRDVSAIAAYESSLPSVASVDDNGRITGRERGQAAITIRYLDRLESYFITVVQDVPGFVWKASPENGWIDQLVNRKLKQLQYLPSGTCADEVFIRRVSLDLTGLLPSPDRVRKFLADCARERNGAMGQRKDSVKGSTGQRVNGAAAPPKALTHLPVDPLTSPKTRARLIDELLETEEYARFWALKKADLMRVSPKRLKDGGADRFAAWLVDAVRANMPHDRFAREILTSAGDTRTVAAANYFLAIPSTEERTEMTAQIFMGSRVECAKCHNHPFESWTMRDYYSISAVFARTQTDKLVVKLASTGEALNPATREPLRPWGMSEEQARSQSQADRRTFFVDWLTRPGNPFFARVEVNRIWSDLLGRGIVEPIDDFRSSNPPSNVPLLDALAKELEQSGFDRKHMIRLICNSRTYQRSTDTNRFNETDEKLFSHARIRLLTAEQVKDAIAVATRALPPRPADDAQRPRYATQRAYSDGAALTTAFGQPQRDTACTCERQTSPTLLQALELLNGGGAHQMARTGSASYAQLPNAALVEELYLAALSRKPNAKEKATTLAYLGKAPDRAEAVMDLVWTLVNTQEFLFQH